MFCDGPTVCRSPVKDVPCHKACAETWITRHAADAADRARLIRAYTPAGGAAVNDFRVIFHAHVCPDCGSDDITESEVETGDGITEIALTCTALRHRLAGGLRRGLEHQAMTGQHSASSTCCTSTGPTGTPATTSAGPTTSSTGSTGTPPATAHGWSRSSGKPGSASPLVRICEGTRRTERAIKNAGGAVRYCPACTPHPRNGHWAPLCQRLHPPHLPQPPPKAVPHVQHQRRSGGRAQRNNPYQSSTSCSSASTAPRPASPGGGAPN